MPITRSNSSDGAICQCHRKNATTSTYQPPCIHTTMPVYLTARTSQQQRTHPLAQTPPKAHTLEPSPRSTVLSCSNHRIYKKDCGTCELLAVCSEGSTGIQCGGARVLTRLGPKQLGLVLDHQILHTLPSTPSRDKELQLLDWRRMSRFRSRRAPVSTLAAVLKPSAAPTWVR